MMNAKRLAQYLAGEAMDADVSSLRNDLAEHKKECEAKPGNCPKEKALRQEVEKAEGPKDEADAGVSSPSGDGKGEGSSAEPELNLTDEEDGRVDAVFNITSSRINATDDSFSYHKNGTAFAERQPISIDGNPVALADHLIDGRLRELVGESSDYNLYYLFFDGSKIGSVRDIEKITGKRVGDSESDAEVLTFSSEKELLEAYDKLKNVSPDAFNTKNEWVPAKGLPSNINAYEVKKDFYDATRQESKGSKRTYDIDKGVEILSKMTPQELDDLAWVYRIGKYDDSVKDDGEESALSKALKLAMATKESSAVQDAALAKKYLGMC